VIAGIFVGGAASRFGGIAKGMLATSDGETVVGRLVRIVRAIGIDPVFVGKRPGYETVGLPTISDLGTGLGPLGGLCSLYRHVLQNAGDDRVVVLACDMPFVSSASLERLCTASGPLVAARRDGRWEPFFSAHDARVMLPRVEAALSAERLSLQSLFAEAAVIDVDPHELDDWDSPTDRG
jgi:molybdopterin-guanine dinucleotide biosynthesis protein A